MHITLPPIGCASCANTLRQAFARPHASRTASPSGWYPRPALAPTQHPGHETRTVPLGEVTRSAGPVLIVTGPHGTIRHPLPPTGPVVVGRGSDCELRVDDPGLSRRHATFTLDPRPAVTDLGSSNGTRIAARPLAPHTAHPLREGEVVELGTSVALMQGLDVGADAPDGARARAWELARRIARTELAALIVGPPGIGKLHLSRLLHAWSTRSETSAVVLDCANLGMPQLERLRQTTGELTVVLQRIDQTPPPMQGALATALAPTRLRPIATTRTDPELSATRLRLYERLLQRVRGVEIRLPALAASADDFVALVDDLVREAATVAGMRHPPTLAPDAVKPLQSRVWPRNVQDLRIVVRRTVVGCFETRLGPSDWQFDGGSVISPQDAERERIVDALARCGGNQTKAAKLLKISRRTLVSRLDQYKIVRPRKRS